MTNVQYLPALPELIEIDMEALYACPEDEAPGDDMLEEFQMKAELTAMRLNMQRKNQRMRHIHDY